MKARIAFIPRDATDMDVRGSSDLVAPPRPGPAGGDTAWPGDHLESDSDRVARSLHDSVCESYNPPNYREACQGRKECRCTAGN